MAILGAFLLIGIAAARSAKGSGDTQSTILDRALLDWLLPIAIAFNLSAAVWSIHSVAIVGISVGITILDACLVLVLSLPLGFDRITRRTLLAVAPLGNTAYFGFAAITALVGSKYLPDAIIFDQVGTTVMFATYGNALARSEGIALSRSDVIGLLLFRPLWGFTIGILLDIVHVNLLSGPASQFGNAISASLLPVAMFALGAKLATHGLRLGKAVVVGVFVRNILGPTLLVLLMLILHLSLSTYTSALLQSAMPAMIAAAILADRRGLDSDVAFSLCAVGIAISCVTLPCMVAVIDHLQ